MGSEEQINKSRNPRRENRMAAVQFLYMREMNREEVLPHLLATFFASKEQPREYFEFAEELIQGTLRYLPEIDAVIKKYASNWDFNRIAKMDLAILRLAIFELKYRSDIPPIVSINEALELTKIFSHEDAKRFINGILDHYKDELDRPLRKASE